MQTALGRRSCQVLQDADDQHFNALIDCHIFRFDGFPRICPGSKPRMLFGPHLSNQSGR